MGTTNGLSKLHIPIITRLGKKDKQIRLLREEAEKAVQELRAQQRRKSVCEARDFLRDFVKERWSRYWSQTRIKCSLTMPELLALGYLPRSEGIRECRKLVSVPVKFDEIGNELWKRLSSMVQELMTLSGDSVDQEIFERQAEFAFTQATAARRGTDDSQVPPAHHHSSSCETQQRMCIFCGEGSVKHDSLPASIRDEPYVASDNHCWNNTQKQVDSQIEDKDWEEALQDRRPSSAKSFSEKLNIVLELGTKTVSIISGNLAYGYGYHSVLLDRTRVICLDA